MWWACSKQQRGQNLVPLHHHREGSHDSAHHLTSKHIHTAASITLATTSVQDILTLHHSSLPAARWEPRTGSSIALAFKAARAVGLQLTPALQNAVASPLLPRGWLNLQLLQWLREVGVGVGVGGSLPALDMGG